MRESPSLVTSPDTGRVASLISPYRNTAQSRGAGLRGWVRSSIIVCHLHEVARGEVPGIDGPTMSLLDGLDEADRVKAPDRDGLRRAAQGCARDARGVAPLPCPRWRARTGSGRRRAEARSASREPLRAGPLPP